MKSKSLAQNLILIILVLATCLLEFGHVSFLISNYKNISNTQLNTSVIQNKQTIKEVDLWTDNLTNTSNKEIVLKNISNNMNEMVSLKVYFFCALFSNALLAILYPKTWTLLAHPSEVQGTSSSYTINYIHHTLNYRIIL